MSGSDLSVLVLAEHDGTCLSVDTLRTMGAVNDLMVNAESARVDVLILGSECQLVASEAAKLSMLIRFWWLIKVN